MHLKIITHERVVFDGNVDAIYTKGTDGEFGVLEGHVPVMAALDVGVTRVVHGNEQRFFTTMGGIFQLKDNHALILTNTAECGDEIDAARAKESLDRAQARLLEAKAETDAKRAEAAVARAMVRLKAISNK
ncbi:MAG: ATP synthase F1 subunit epsilon [Heliobacteriaceae bacterium]|jgi:F-type H+-transporting ATPase subunit epsilon|nr:ATP synthase F1 subunit epsilon [Heliobacteriaceae bacterium]